VVGQPCASDKDCAGVGGGAFCKLTTPSGLAYPNGYCTALCPGGGTCPGTANCVDFGALNMAFGVNSYGESTAFCLAPCNWDGDCNSPDYACFGGNQPDSTNTTYVPGFGCFINPPATTQTGQPCASVADCAFPPTNGFCFQQINQADGGTEYTDGYCSSSCLGALFNAEDPSSFCGDGGTCLIDGLDSSGNPNSASCYSLCPAPGAGQSTCRFSYLCAPLNQADGGQVDSGICQTPCWFTGCSAGTTCSDAGWCQ
jgi:hypothetical protein